MPICSITEKVNKITLDVAFLKTYYPIFVNCLENTNNVNLGFVIVNILHSLHRFFKQEIAEDCTLFKKYLQKLILTDHNYYINSTRLIIVLKQLPNNYDASLKTLVIDNWDKLLTFIIKHSYDSDDLASLEPLHKLYKMNLNETIENDEIRLEIEQKLVTLFSKHSNDSEKIVKDDDILETYNDMGKSHTVSYIEDKYWDFYCDFLGDCGFSDYYDNLNHDPEYNATDILEEILKNCGYRDNEYQSEAIYDKDYSPEEEIRMIDELFS